MSIRKVPVFQVSPAPPAFPVDLGSRARRVRPVQSAFPVSRAHLGYREHPAFLVHQDFQVRYLVIEAIEVESRYRFPGRHGSCDHCAAPKLEPGYQSYRGFQKKKRKKA